MKYVICFKGGQKIEVDKVIAENISRIKNCSGYFNTTMNFPDDNRENYVIFLCLTDILYIQPKEKEINPNTFTISTADGGKFSSTTATA